MARHIQASTVPSHLAANIDNPTDFRRAASHYFPTKLSIDFVNLLAYHSLQGGAAHSLQGAYGIGKSSLGIFTMNLLASKTKIFKPTKQIKSGWKIHPSVRRVLKSGGMLSIPVIGSASPLAQRISVGLRTAADNHLGRRPKALLQFTRLAPQEVTNDLLLQGIEDLLDDKHTCPGGVLLIIDEFGRQFEHMIATGLLDDLHLLQNLAELPGKGRVPFNIVIIQHHGLDHYTSRFMSQQHAEWEKVRGRFNEFLLSNTETDTANIVTPMIESAMTNSSRRSTGKRQRSARGKSTLLEKGFLAAARKCHPLHPMTIFILSRLAKLLGQGDRTVVGWLSSHLDTGFHAALDSADGVIYPDSLFRHFFGDIQNFPTNPAIAKKFNAVHSAYSRHGADDQELEARLLKTIGLLYFCQGTGLKPDLETIKYSLPEAGKIKEAIISLVSKSLISFRRHSNEYRVWEGSDYDIQTKLNDVMQNTVFSPAEAISNFAPRRVLAHKHFIKTGNHRTANVVWLDKKHPAPEIDKNHEPHVFIWLDEAPKKNPDMLRNCVMGLIYTRGFIDQLLEASALQHMIENDLELQQDIVASGEVSERLAYMQSVIENKVSAALNTQVKWRLGNRSYPILQQATSEMMDRIYSKSFELHNEMINREQTSGQATLAIRLLIEAMVQRHASPRFGIEKFPAERLLYERVFHNTNLHKNTDNAGWQLNLNKPIDSGLKEVFGQIYRMAEAGSSHNPCGVDLIVADLGKPPYGIKPLPVLLLCSIYIFICRDEIELYEDGSLQPTWSYQTLTRMVKAPGSFSINVPETVKYPASVLTEYRQALHGQARRAGNNTPLNIAKDILLRYSTLPTYAKQTASVSAEAVLFRRAILNARSPADLLFVDLPRIFGLRDFPKQKQKRKEYLQNLASTVAELEQAELSLVKGFETILLKECAKRSLKSARAMLGDRAQRISSDSHMHYASDSFLNGLLDESNANTQQWLRNVLEKGLDILTPLDAWSDDEVARAEFTFRTRLIWLRQASAAMPAPSEAIGNTILPNVLGNGNAGKSKNLSAIRKQLKTLPPEQVVPVLLELLRQHSGAWE